jgi:very-short-patch-repair endonuclease
VTSEFPKARGLLEAHHHERTRPNASGAAIVSVVTGQRGHARRAFASWAATRGLPLVVAASRDTRTLQRCLDSFPLDSALLFVPPSGQVLPAAAIAAEIAAREPQRAVGLAVTVADLEAALDRRAEIDSSLYRALLGGLVFATDQAQRAMSQQIRRARDQLYRSDHENALHVLMRQRQDIGDLFAVNQRVRLATRKTAYEVDFWAESLRLAVEVDGRQHATEVQRRRDDRRDETLSAAGIRTLRIHAAKVIADPTATLNHIAAVVAERRKELARRAITAG